MFERPRSGERALLVNVAFGRSVDTEDVTEFEELTKSAGATSIATITSSRAAPHPRFLVGSGKVDEIREQAQATDAELVIFDHALTPSQERNLERELSCRVLDRNGLILDIFAQRARTFEGKLQVELAQLKHLSTRLVRGWTHLERQKGGIGLRGPGETQLETDRRLIGQRIKTLNRRLAKVANRREQSRKTRFKHGTPTVSLVGYTNAGKSTVFNSLTGADLYTADQLFATLDPTLRRLELPAVMTVVLADTVGFIRELPHELVAAFRSTLEETRDASLLLHVVDVSDPDRHEHIRQVNEVLAGIDAGDVPQIEVHNKTDLMEMAPRVERDRDGRVTRVWVSAMTGKGMDLLLQAIGAHFQRQIVRSIVRLPSDAGKIRAELFDLGTVLDERIDGEGNWELELEITSEILEELCQREGLDHTDLVSEPCALKSGFLRSRSSA